MNLLRRFTPGLICRLCIGLITTGSAIADEPQIRNEKDRHAAFESIKFDYPAAGGQGPRLAVSSDGSYEFFLLAKAEAEEERKVLHGQTGELAPKVLAELDRYLAATDYLKNTDVNDAIPGGYGGNCDLSIRYKSQSYSLKLRLWNEDGPYDKLMHFVHDLVVREYGKMPELPWQRYTKKRFDDAVAKGLPVLQYFYCDVVAHEIYGDFGQEARQFPSTLDLVKQHGVVCLNATRQFTKNVIGTRDPQSPNYIDPTRDGLSLYLPKTKQSIFISNRTAAGVHGALRRAFVEPADGKVDIGGRDFMVMPHPEPTNIGGANFAIHTESDWVLPEKKGEKRGIPIKLGVSSGPVYFPRAGTYFPTLETPDGKNHVLIPPAREYSVDDILAGGGYTGIYVFAYFEMDHETGQFDFVYRHSKEDISRVGPISPGEYRFSLNLCPCPLTDEQRKGKRPENLWSGRGTTAAVPITVHEFSKTVRPRTVDGWKP